MGVPCEREGADTKIQTKTKIKTLSTCNAVERMDCLRLASCVFVPVQRHYLSTCNDVEGMDCLRLAYCVFVPVPAIYYNSCLFLPLL